MGRAGLRCILARDLTDAHGRYDPATGYTPDQMRPYALTYNLSVQRMLARDYTIEVRYMGSRGVHLLVQQQLNRISPVTSTRNIPTFLAKPSAADLAALTLTPSALQATPSNAWRPSASALRPTSTAATRR